MMSFTSDSHFLNICVMSLLHLQGLLLVFGLQDLDLHLSLETNREQKCHICNSIECNDSI